MYLEGPDQYRGWFHSSLLVGVAVRTVRRTGTCSRTAGRSTPRASRCRNRSAILFYQPRFAKSGAPTCCALWVASQDYTADVRMSDNVMTQLSEAYRKAAQHVPLRVGNLADFDPARDSVPDAEMEELDRWMLSRTGELVKQCRQVVQGFEFHRVFHALHDFAVVDLSALFRCAEGSSLHIRADNHARVQRKTAMYRIAKALLGLLTPITVFTAEGKSGDIFRMYRRSGECARGVFFLRPKRSALRWMRPRRRTGKGYLPCARKSACA